MDERFETSQKRDMAMTLFAAAVVGWAVRGVVEKVRYRIAFAKLKGTEL